MGKAFKAKGIDWLALYTFLKYDVNSMNAAYLSIVELFLNI